MSDLETVPRVISAPTEADFLLPPSARARIMASVAPNTKRAYEKAWADFGAWCRGAGRIAFPVTAETLAAYVDHLALPPSPRSPASIERDVACIRRMHREAGFEGHPDLGLAKKALRGYRREWAKGGGRARQATPVVITALRLMVATCDPATAVGARNRALAVLGFAMMGRRSELVALDIADLTEQPDGLDVLIRMSKTDQDARGEVVFVPYGEHEETCPVRTVRAWRSALAAQGVTSGALFRSVDQKDRIAGSAERPNCTAMRLTGKSVNSIVQRMALLAGLDAASGYGAHSLRAGGATAAYEAGQPVSAITDQGRWSRRSPTVLGYIRAVDKRKNNPMKGIGL